jgi:hypothetical protein
MMDDEQLLHAYARERSESAFGEPVTRLRCATARQEAQMKLQDYETGQPRNMWNTRKANYARPPQCRYAGRENYRLESTNQPSEDHL